MYYEEPRNQESLQLWRNVMAHTIAISKKNQITIPQSVVNQLGFKDKAEYIVSGGQFILKPARDDTGDYFSEEILADLISSGYTGEELLMKFKETKRQVPAAVELMIKESEDKAAEVSDEELWGDV